jgi:hypothetical protein
MLEPGLGDWLRENQMRDFFCGMDFGEFGRFAGIFGEKWMVKGGVSMVSSW